MKKIKLQEQETFIVNNTGQYVSYGEITGNYLLISKLDLKGFYLVKCLDSDALYIINA